jgi:ABC-2 type transport system permease protein
METLIGLVSFWFLEVSSMIFIFMMVNYFLSGHMVPLDWLPSLFSRWPAAHDFVRSGMMYLPFPYLAYFPASLMLGKHAGPEMWTYLAVGSAWVALLFAASRIAFARGLRRYSAFGG